MHQDGYQYQRKIFFMTLIGMVNLLIYMGFQVKITTKLSICLISINIQM